MSVISASRVIKIIIVISVTRAIRASRIICLQPQSIQLY
jgi:hypothetical protein